MKTNLQKTVITVFLASVLLNTVRAQINSSSEPCLSGVRHRQLMQSDPEYLKRIQENEIWIQNIINTGFKSGNTYVIPVVVHVLHLGEPEGTGTNISTAQINSAIANMNTCFGGGGSYPQNIDVQFQLAQRDPNCNPSTGILRINASGTSDYAANGITTSNEVTIKALSKWPNGEYYNIWVVSEIDGNNGGSGTQGYAYFPGAGSDKDGTAILYNSFGYDPTNSLGYNLKTYTNLNVTALHELGHAFNLYHTFEGDDANDDGVADQCPINVTCTTDGDKCCDTEAHKRDDGDCGATGTTCTGQNISDVVQNIMAYSSDVCQIKFTAEQKARMRAAISGPRGSLLNSPGLLPISGTSPLVAKSCSPQTSNLSNNYGMGVYGLTIGTTTYSSSGTIADGGFRNNWCSNFNLNTNTSYSITVTNGTINGEKVKVFIDYNNDGDFIDAGEEIYSDNTGAFTHTGSFTTAAAPVTGQPIWIRVISDFSTISGSCYVPTYGQVEDFSVTFSDPCVAPTVGTITQPTCTTATGSVVLNGLPSSGTWTLTRSPGGSTTTGTGTTSTITGLTPGTYTYTVTDGNGCTSTASANIVIDVQPTPPTATISGTTAVCENTSSPVINFTATNGTPPYTFTYTINGGNNQTVTTSNGNSVTTSVSTTIVDTFSYALVSVQDSSGCSQAQSGNAVITVNATPSVPTIGTITQPTCATPSGSVDISNLPVSGSWTLTQTPGGNQTNGSGSGTTISGISGGTYTYIVTDSAGCASDTTASVSINTFQTAAVTPVANMNVCNGDTIAEISFSSTPSGATFSWTNPDPTIGLNGNGTGSIQEFTAVNTATTPVITTITVTPTYNSCAGTATAFSITVNPIPTITQSGTTLTADPASSYQWYLNGQAISGATSQSYTVIQNGDYTVVLDNNTCASSIVNFNSTGISQINQNHFFSIYPNPNDGTFYLTFNVKSKANYKIKITNTLGALVSEEMLQDFNGSYSKQVDLTRFGKGTYLISISGGEMETIKKVLTY